MMSTVRTHRNSANLVRIITITSFVTLIIAAIAAGWLYKAAALQLLETQTEEANIAFGRILNNTLHVGIESKLGVNSLFADASNKFISDAANHAYLNNTIRDIIEQTQIVKVTIFNLKWKVVYSTVASDIGRTMTTDYIKQQLNTGHYVTKIEQHKKTTLNSSSTSDLTLLSTYLPMKIKHENRGDDVVHNVFEIYVDVTKQYEAMFNSLWQYIFIVSAGLATIFAILFFTIRKVDSLISKSHHEMDNELQKIEKINIILGKNFAKVASKRDRAVQESEAKSRFLANMSHELRTPLNAIIGYSEIIAEDIEEQNQSLIIEDAERINSAGKHLLSIINDILDISKVEAGKMELHIEEFNIDIMVREVVDTIKPIAKYKNNKVILTFNNRSNTMKSDLTRTRQILLNLISNSNKFTVDGEIYITVNDSYIDNCQFIEFIVQDTGIGMEEKYLDNIFNPFSQGDSSSTKEQQGTGLGLTISKVFCEIMNGHISVTSELKKGSEFIVRLPVDVRSMQPISHEYGDYKYNDNFINNPQVKANRVLIIDDEPDARDLLSRILISAGFHVVAVGTGLEGLRIAKTNNIDIISLDVMLPGMDGWSVLRALKRDSETENIPVVMSSSIDERDIALSIGAGEYILKPFDREEVQMVFYRILGIDMKSVIKK